MPSLSRRLYFTASLGLFLIICYLFLQPDPYLPFRPNLSPQQAKNLALDTLQQQYGVKTNPNDWQVTQEENVTAEQYLHRLNKTFDFEMSAGSLHPLIYWKIISTHNAMQNVWVNQKTGRVEAIQGIPLHPSEKQGKLTLPQIAHLIEGKFQTRLAPLSTVPSNTGTVVATYVTGFSFAGLTDVIELETTNGIWTGFSHHMVTPGEQSIGQVSLANSLENVTGIFNLYVLIFPLIGLMYFMFFAKRVAGMRWRTPVFASVLTGLGVWLQEGSVSSVAGGLLFGSAVLVVMQIVYRGTLDGFAKLRNANWTRHQLVLGYCLFFMQAGVSVSFMWMSEHLGGWTSDVQGKEMIALSPWPLLLPFATGFAAAIFEELVYRKFADVWLRPLIGTTWCTALVSSLLWAFAHLGYDVAPWYLRIIELGLVVGPMSYWMYRTYGLFPTILAHFLYNLFVTCHDLVSYFGHGYELTYLYLLSPLLLLLWSPVSRNLLNSKSRMI